MPLNKTAAPLLLNRFALDHVNLAACSARDFGPIALIHCKEKTSQLETEGAARPRLFAGTCQPRLWPPPPSRSPGTSRGTSESRLADNKINESEWEKKWKKNRTESISVPSSVLDSVASRRRVLALFRFWGCNIASGNHGMKRKEDHLQKNLVCESGCGASHPFGQRMVRHGMQTLGTFTDYHPRFKHFALQKTKLQSGKREGKR